MCVYVCVCVCVCVRVSLCARASVSARVRACEWAWYECLMNTRIHADENNAVAALLLLEGIDVQCSAGHSSAVHSAVLATAVANLSAAERRVLRRRTGRGCDVPHSRHSPWRRGNQAVAFASRGAQAFALASR